MTSAASAQPASAVGRRVLDRLLVLICAGSAALCVLVLGWLLASIAIQGWGHLGLDFLRHPPSRRPDAAGIFPAAMGSIWICAVCALSAIPLGVGSAILLEEYRPRGRRLAGLHAFVQVNVVNLAGVPSVVYGILGLTAFVGMFGWLGGPGTPAWSIGGERDWYHLRLPLGRGVLASGLTLMLVVLPIVIVATQEALRAVPSSLRQGSLALGATHWQTIWRATLPTAVPGIMTGVILAMSRAVGEAAPILVVAGIVYIRFAPHNLMDDATVMPLQIYDWASRPQDEFHRVAAAGILVLLAVLLCFNCLAIVIRQRARRSHP